MKYMSFLLPIVVRMLNYKYSRNDIKEYIDITDHFRKFTTAIKWRIEVFLCENIMINQLQEELCF